MSPVLPWRLVRYLNRYVAIVRSDLVSASILLSGTKRRRCSGSCHLPFLGFRGP